MSAENTLRTGTFSNITLTVINGMLEIKNVLKPLARQIIPIANISIIRRHAGKVTIHANDGSKIVIPTWKSSTVTDFINNALAANGG